MRTTQLTMWVAVLAFYAAEAGAQGDGKRILPPNAFAADAVRGVPWPSSYAEPLPIDTGAQGLWQALKKLRTRASLMTIVAHPDDEDGVTLTHEARGEGVRTALLTLNRGEGGQNIVSNAQWDDLGLLRTKELEAADRHYGVEQQYWTRVVDFGFSKTREEALEQWGHDRVLYDVVRAVRINRPLVITSTFVGGLTDGHGQHQVSGEMAQEVFNAAGDPNVFPDQIAAGLRPWKPLKMYARQPFFRVTEKGMYDYATQKWAPVRFYDYIAQKWMDQKPATNVVVEESARDPKLDASYYEIARTGLKQQRSQIANVNFGPGTGEIEYHRYGSRVPTTEKEQSFFDGMDVSLPGIAALAPGAPGFLREELQKIDASAARAVAAYHPKDLPVVAPDLADGLKLLNGLVDEVEKSRIPAADKEDVLFELREKQRQFNDALLLALGIEADVTVIRTGTPGAGTDGGGGQVANPGKAVTVRVTYKGAAQLDKAESVSGDGNVTEVRGGKTSPLSFEMRFSADVPLTKPYFSRPNVEQPFYDIDDARWLNLSQAPYPAEVRLFFRYRGVLLRVARVVQAAAKNAGGGAGEEPLVLGPDLSVRVEPEIGAMPIPGHPVNLSITLQSNTAEQSAGEVAVALPKGWRSEPERPSFKIAETGAATTEQIKVSPSDVGVRNYTIAIRAKSHGGEYGASFVRLGYPGLQPIYASHPAEYRVVGVDAKIAPGLNVGYVMGTGDNVPAALTSLGANVHLLTDEELAHGELQKYDAIMLGIRTYTVRDALKNVKDRLLDYVHKSGVMIVEYNQAPYDHEYGPYPYTLSSDPERVIEERAKVNILEPGSSLLQWPNVITAGDFDGWVEERGHSFMKSWDPHYLALTETHDAGQEPQKGGLLVAEYGSGKYVYLAYALYRQLDEGVPGAYRILANLVSAGRRQP